MMGLRAEALTAAADLPDLRLLEQARRRAARRGHERLLLGYWVGQVLGEHAPAMLEPDATSIMIEGLTFRLALGGRGLAVWECCARCGRQRWTAPLETPADLGAWLARDDHRCAAVRAHA